MFSRLLIISLCLSVFLWQAPFAQAAVCDDRDDCQEKIKEYEEKIKQARADQTSLASQIQLISTKIELAQARLVKTEADIELTRQEIDDLGTKIDRLNESLDHLSHVLLQKIVEGYKRRNASMLEILLSPEASSFTNQVKYIHIAQENDRVLALRTQQVKVNFSEQKNLREEKVAELEELEQQLEAQKVELDNQSKQKSALLDQTRSDEKRYQQLLSQALAEYNAVEQAIATGRKVGSVKKGDPIALVGNTGFPYCSTGAHLHFEVRKGGKWVNPGDYVGDGKSWDHPLSPPVIMTQEFGVTPYSWRYSYSGGIHTGWDMVSKASDVIRAPSDGELYSSTQNCSGAIIKIRYIVHSTDLISYYLHVQ